MDLSTSDSTPMERAKRPRSGAAGLYGHPIHPILVTVPIGAWISSLVFDVAAKVGSRPDTFATGSAWLIGIGLVGAVLAGVFGAIDFSTLARGTKAYTTGLTHLAINVVVLVLYIVNLVVRGSGGYEDVSTVAIILSVVGLGLLGASGWLGGKLAYHYGVRVADEATQAEGFVERTRPGR